MVINLGDQLSFLSGGILKATIHRGKTISPISLFLSYPFSFHHHNSHISLKTVVRPPPDQESTRRIALFLFAQARPGLSLEPLSAYSPRVAKEGRDAFAGTGTGKAPTTDEWVKARVRSYGVAELIKGEEYDTEIVGGIAVRHHK